MMLSDLLTANAVVYQNGVHDFVSGSQEDYCGNFGCQWNRFRDIQIDSLSGKTESHRRFFTETAWHPEDLKGKLLLDAGCGAGRFAEVAMECGARVVAVDLSEAVYACSKTLERFSAEDRLILRASLLDLPLRERAFDGIYCLGVLQHTPDPLGTLRQLARFLSPGGRLAIWVYERRLHDIKWVFPRTYVRAAVGNWPLRAKFTVVRLLTATFFPVGWILSWLGRPGELASYLLPYAARHHLARGGWGRQWDYCVMDTLDWYGPKYDQPQTEADLKQVMQSAGLLRIRRLAARGMAIVGEGE